MQRDKHALGIDRDSSLERIAHTLGVPRASFFAQTPAPRGIEEVVANEGEAQALAVMRLFLKLKDPEARTRCVTFISEEVLRNR